MRIAQVITCGRRLYGAQRHVLDLCVAARDQGHEVLVLVGASGDLTAALEVEGVPWRLVPALGRAPHPIQDVLALAQLVRRLRSFGPDVVASHSSKAGTLARLASWWLGLPNTFTAHGWAFEEGVPWTRRQVFLGIERLVGLVTDTVITVADRGRELALRHRVVAPEKLARIYYGVADAGAGRIPQPSPPFTMAMVAGFREQKDHRTLIQALARLADRPWQLFLLGDGPLQGAVRDLVHRLGLDGRVHFEGMVDDVAGYLLRTDLLVLTTHWEGLPISILEGLTFGLPVLATDVSGVREQVLDGVNGVLVPPRDEHAVARALARLMDHPEQLEALAAASRPLYLERFTLDRMCAETLQLYRRLVDARQDTRTG